MAQLIVISPQYNIPNETRLIHKMFEQGLELLHVRKPGLSKKELNAYLRQINPDYQHKIVLHDHHDLAENFNIKRLHFKEHLRVTFEQLDYSFKISQHYTISTSVHDSSKAIKLGRQWSYAMLSPIYDSISKPQYKGRFNGVIDLSLRKTKLIALGGITAANANETLQKGFDGIAVLGAIWERPNNAITEFKKLQELCTETVLTY